MRILFLGDIVGQPGVAFVKKALAAVVAHEQIDLVIANAEHASGGPGIARGAYRELRAAGIDLTVMGRRVDRVLSTTVAFIPSPFDVATGDPRLGGAVVDVDPQTGRATAIRRLMLDEAGLAGLARPPA